MQENILDAGTNYDIYWFLPYFINRNIQQHKITHVKQAWKYVRNNIK